MLTVLESTLQIVIHTCAALCCSNGQVSPTFAVEIQVGLEPRLPLFPKHNVTFLGISRQLFIAILPLLWHLRLLLDALYVMERLTGEHNRRGDERAYNKQNAFIENIIENYYENVLSICLCLWCVCDFGVCLCVRACVSVY